MMEQTDVEEKQPGASENGEATDTSASAAATAPVEAAAPAETVAPEAPAEAVLSPEDDPMKWYVVHTYSGYEQKARLALLERIKQHKMDKQFAEVLIPSENVIELVRGEKKTTSRKFFPGYMLVKMILSDTTWHLVKSTPKITGFVGNAINPPAVPEEEVSRITNQMAQGSLKPRPKVQFEEGESVRVVDGPFVNFNGVVEEVKPDKGKLRVLVSIFGRSTPVELDFVQVEKN
jgi:transcription termination/antitermination protein NusG